MNEEAPVKSLEKEWNNGLRMDVLFAPFRHTSLNPVHYEHKLKLWQDCIEELFEKKSRISLTGDEIMRCFERNGRLPRDVAVANAAATTKSPSIVSSYLYTLTRFFTLPIGWLLPSWSTADYHSDLRDWNGGGGCGADDDDDVVRSKFEQTQFICVKVLDEKINTLLRLVSESEKPELNLKNSVLMSKDKLLMLYTNSNDDNAISFDEFQLILNHLLEQRKAALLSQDSTIIKISVNGRRPVSPFNQLEITSMMMKEAETKVERSLENIEHSIDESMSRIKDQLKCGEKSSALRTLKRKKILEKERDKRENVLFNLQTLTSQLESSGHHKTVVDAYAMGSEALKSVLKDLDVDKVENMMEELNETIEDQNEISQVLSIATTADDADVEKELEDLLREDELEGKLEKLPNPPSNLDMDFDEITKKLEDFVLH